MYNSAWNSIQSYCPIIFGVLKTQCEVFSFARTISWHREHVMIIGIGNIWWTFIKCCVTFSISRICICTSYIYTPLRISFWSRVGQNIRELGKHSDSNPLLHPHTIHATGIFTYIYHKIHQMLVNIPYMDGMGMYRCLIRCISHFLVFVAKSISQTAALFSFFSGLDELLLTFPST